VQEVFEGTLGSVGSNRTRPKTKSNTNREGTLKIQKQTTHGDVEDIEDDDINNRVYDSSRTPTIQETITRLSMGRDQMASIIQNAKIKQVEYRS
jgi:hypothetical protein